MLYNIKQISKWCDVHPVTVRRWIQKGELKATKHPYHRYLISREELEKFLDNHPKYAHIRPTLDKFDAIREVRREKMIEKIIPPEYYVITAARWNDLMNDIIVLNERLTLLEERIAIMTETEERITYESDQA